MLEIEMEFIKGILFIRLDGKLNASTCDKLYQEVSEMIFDNGIRNIVFNLENISEIDINGINSLIYNYKLCKQNKGESIICNINSTVERAFQGSMKGFIPITSNELTALNIFNI
jgi:stage II sporulation protein AA (anti-sigma F factor antagonist)